jgi:ribosomal protein S18 acetylase RimI-like enzyme
VYRLGVERRRAVANYDGPVEVLELDGDDAASAIALWAEAGLTRPWNDPEADFQRALNGATSSVLGLKHDNELVGSVMVGYDGHRGWVYYLAVAEDHRHQGLGSELMRAAEGWLRKKGAVKVQLMVRSENESALSFYENAGYEASDVRVLSRWLEI